MFGSACLTSQRPHPPPYLPEKENCGAHQEEDNEASLYTVMHHHNQGVYL